MTVIINYIAMKTFLARQNPPKEQPLAVRRRVKSVRLSLKREFDQMPEEEAIMNRLRRGLEKDLDNEQVQATQPSVLLPDTDVIKIENKLWRYFVGRMELVREKVEKERLNVCEKELEAIKQQANRKKMSNREQIARAQAKIQAKNREIHGLFEEIKQERMTQENIANWMKAKKRRVQQVIEDRSPERISEIKESIQRIRNEVAKTELELQHCQGELFKVQEQWKSFLIHFLKEGYYFQEGATGILKEMVEIGYSPTINDFPPFLDHTSRQCLLAEYSRIKNQVTSPQSTKQMSKSQQESESRKNMRQIATKENLQNIYNETRDYMTQWIRNQGWKRETILPRIQSTKSTCQKMPDWRGEQKKRLLFMDDKQRYKKVRALLFGSKVDTVM